MYRFMSHWFGIVVFSLALAPVAISGATSSDATVVASPEKAHIEEDLIADRGHRGHRGHHHHSGHYHRGHGWGGSYYYNSSPYYYYPNYYRGSYYSPYYYNSGYYYGTPYYYNTSPGFSIRIGL